MAHSLTAVTVMYSNQLNVWWWNVCKIIVNYFNENTSLKDIKFHSLSSKPTQTEIEAFIFEISIKFSTNYNQIKISSWVCSC